MPKPVPIGRVPIAAPRPEKSPAQSPREEIRVRSGGRCPAGNGHDKQPVETTAFATTVRLNWLRRQQETDAEARALTTAAIFSTGAPLTVANEPILSTVRVDASLGETFAECFLGAVPP